MEAVLNWILLSVEEPAVLTRTAMLPRLFPVSRLGAGRTMVLRMETAALWPLMEEPVSLSAACPSWLLTCQNLCSP